MAVTEAASRLTVEYRAEQLALRAGSIRNLMLLWKAVDPTRLGDTIDVFSHAAALLTSQGFDQSAALGEQYFTAFRGAENVRGRAPRIGLPAKPSLAKTQGLLRGSALSGIINARRSGASLQIASSNGLVNVIGTMAKLILSGGNNTVLNGVQADRQATGWARVTSSGACAFCRMLSSRGAVYRSERSAGFEPHDHCACTAEPIYGAATPLDQSKEHRNEYQIAQAWARQAGNLSSGTSNNALNNYRRWLAAGKPTPGSDGGASDGGNSGE